MSEPKKESASAAEKPKQEGGKKKDKKDKKKKDEGKGAAPAKKDEKKAEPARTAPVIKHPDDAIFGDLATIQSAYKTTRTWTDIFDLNASKDGQDVWIRARVHTNRDSGKMAFLLLRRGFATVQCAIWAGAGGLPKEFQKYAVRIPPESVVDVFGTVKKVDKPVQSATQSDVEIQVKKIYCVSASLPVLPFQMEDAARREGGEEKKAGEKEKEKAKDKDGKEVLDITVGTDLRLDHRWMDLRTPANHAIFRLQSRVCQFYRSFFVDKGFVEIHSPKITPGVSEGGSEVFRLDYFGRPACLAQSPQLFKQMAVNSDLFRVFEIGPVFRAENSNTHRHMCEFTGMDFEMEIKEHYHEILQTIGGCMVYIFKKLNEFCKPELEAVRKQYPFEDLQFRDETLVLSFREAHDLLIKNGEPIGEMDDFSTPQEKKLGQIVKKEYKTDFYIVDRYPITVRPFYTMPCADDARYTNSYDVFLRGEEITSGAQRIHDVALLRERAAACKIPESNIAKYLESFKFGAYPHGGGGIGLERVVMLFLGLDNIRKTALFPRTPNRLEP